MLLSVTAILRAGQRRAPQVTTVAFTAALVRRRTNMKRTFTGRGSTHVAAAATVIDAHNMMPARSTTSTLASLSASGTRSARANAAGELVRTGRGRMRTGRSRPSTDNFRTASACSLPDVKLASRRRLRRSAAPHRHEPFIADRLLRGHGAVHAAVGLHIVPPANRQVGRPSRTCRAHAARRSYTSRRRRAAAHDHRHARHDTHHARWAQIERLMAGTVRAFAPEQNRSNRPVAFSEERDERSSFSRRIVSGRGHLSGQLLSSYRIVSPRDRRRARDGNKANARLHLCVISPAPDAPEESLNVPGCVIAGRSNARHAGSAASER